MPRIFICYRRDDTAGHTGRLRDGLCAEFGDHEIFRDVDTIGPGDDFVQAVERGIASCRVFLAIIGRQWLTSSDREGRRRLDDPADHVRTEVAKALECGVRVIPVLVQGASMPASAKLPDNIKRFADHNAIELDDEGWASDVRRLFDAIEQELHRSPRPGNGSRRRLRLRQAYVGLFAAAALVVVVLVARHQPEPSRPTAASAASPDSPADPAGARADPATPGPETRVSFPAGAEAQIGALVYEVQDATVTSTADSRTLTVRMRVTNHSQYDATFFDSGFRLDVDGQPHGATSGNNEVVAANSAREHTITFSLPPHAASATLRVTNGGETAAMPVDLNGRSGPSAAQDRELRRSGKRTFAVPVSPDAARMRFGDLTCELRSTSVHRYSNKLTLTLEVRVRNASRYDAEFGDSHFRLLLDETARPPVSGVSTVVAGESSRDAAIVFDLPLDARNVVLRTRFGERTVEVPLHLPPTA
jgi:TIR domain